MRNSRREKKRDSKRVLVEGGYLRGMSKRDFGREMKRDSKRVLWRWI